ncbi:hypothetical protein N7468_009976 [Penicillium chermesinum]|uniref:NAD-dependent epimerase/dehydratase domain-containing protein n=1 Tax=Penicillium chermesinum TaxID=63820 RepID=A0A9W9NDP8_9EURO|nr:uncharacterized protein N7468_009976 [Penicillium chermesinum]KAJ5216968.1 hypothetical protein N7468_009976 [Penicillium chermesinum]
MATIENPAIPKGSTVLVTGANGFLGSHIVDQFLRTGYRVRAAVRDPRKESWANELFGKLYGKENFELVAVPAMDVEGAFDEIVKGIDIFVHSAAVVTFEPEASKVIPVTIAGALNALKAAYSEPSVKRFVLTSSSTAAVGLLDEPGTIVTEDKYNEKAIKKAWDGPPYEPSHSIIVYEASKAQSEQEVWKYHKEHQAKRPDLVVNTVLPNFIIGRSVDPVGQGSRSTFSLILDLWNGKKNEMLAALPRQHFVDVEDTALLHVAAAVLPHVQGQRIFAFADEFSWDRTLSVMRKIDPTRNLPEEFSDGQGQWNVIVASSKAEKLLQELGRPGWTRFEDSVAANVRDA